MAGMLSSRFAPEPLLSPDQPACTAVLLCNLGTPDAPTPDAVRRYLAQFLADDRVVELPKWAWWPILHGIILRTRPKASAAKYATIWGKGGATGSPLLHWTQRQAMLLHDALAQTYSRQAIRVVPAMRYGNPSIAAQLNALKTERAMRILILPLYPQYSGTTTASVCDAVYDWARTQRHVPELRFVQRYHDDAGYIEALAQSVERHWHQNGRAERLVMSFHGVPERTRDLGDPYCHECQTTAKLLAQRLQLVADQYVVTFQSRFGKAKWLEPYTEPSLIAMAQSGTRSVDVMCPGFTSDCIETLEEIHQEARVAFVGAGGQDFRFIACLNEDRAWINALHSIAQRHLQGWPVVDVHPDTPCDAAS